MFVGATVATASAPDPEWPLAVVIVTAGASASLSSHVSLFLFYSGELGRTDYSSHSVTGGFSYGF